MVYQKAVNPLKRLVHDGVAASSGPLDHAVVFGARNPLDWAKYGTGPHDPSAYCVAWPERKLLIPIVKSLSRVAVWLEGISR